MDIKDEVRLEELMMNNAYDLIINEVSVDELIERGGNIIAFPFDENGDFDVEEVLENCMAFFTMTEEYEKCAEIKKVLDELENIKA